MDARGRVQVPVPRALHVCSAVFLLTVGLVCALVALSAPARYFRDPSLVPDDVGGWVLLTGMALFPVLHWIGVYRRSIVASLLVVPLHIVFLWIVMRGAGQALGADPRDFSNVTFLAIVAAFEVVLIGYLGWWAWYLWAIRRGRIQPRPSAQGARKDYTPEYVAIGSRGWVIERSDFARELRSTTDAIRRKAPWFLPMWAAVRWPLHIMAWGGLIVASLGIPACAVGMVSVLAGGPSGVVFWTLLAVVVGVLFVLLMLSAWMLVRKLRVMIVDIDSLIQVPLFALGITGAILIVPALQRGEVLEDRGTQIESSEEP
jgi:hypothetical protein